MLKTILSALSLRTKIELLVVIVAAVGLWFSFGIHKVKEAAIEDYKVQEVQQVQKVLKEREESSQKAVEAIKKKNYKGRASVDEALQNNNEWAGSRTPDAVVNSMCNVISCTSSDSTTSLQ